MKNRNAGKTIKAIKAYRGASLTSYGLVVGLIAILAIGAVNAVGIEVTGLFETVDGRLQNASSGNGSGSGASGSSGSGNSAPVFVSIESGPVSGRRNVTLGAPVLLASFSDVDGDTLSFRLIDAGDGTSEVDLGFTIASDTADAEVSGTPLSAGSFTVLIEANDGNGGVTLSPSSITINLDTYTGQDDCGETLDPTRAADPALGGPGCETVRNGEVVIYAGETPGGASDFFVAPCDIGMTVDPGNGCTGTRIEPAFNFVDVNIATLPDVPDEGSITAPGAFDGQLNTQILVDPNDDGNPSDSLIGSTDAAARCFNIGDGWYLPSVSELDVIYANLVATDDAAHPQSVVNDSPTDATAPAVGVGPYRATFDTSSSGAYWSSSERDLAVVDDAYRQFFDVGNTTSQDRDLGDFVRCAWR